MKKIIVLLLLFCSIFITSNTNIVSANNLADTNVILEYTDVLDDLKNNKDFKVDTYKEDVNNYNLEIINIAESSSNELFIYIYQPSKDNYFTATSINISTLIEHINFSNYSLKLISSNGVFFKYKVENFKVDFNDDLRVYNISSIFRNANSLIDNIEINNNKITEISVVIAKVYQISTIDGNYTINTYDTEVVKVTSKYCGIVRYENGFSLYPTACDSHFVAFNTDKKIDNLYKAKLSFLTYEVEELWVPFIGSEYKSKFITKSEKTLDYKESVSHKGNGFWASSYSWDRIQTVDSFINSVENAKVFTTPIFSDTFSPKYIIGEADKKILKENKWVLNYLETDYSLLVDGYYGADGSYQVTSRTENYTQVSDITLLELYFQTDGVTYNLGVIDNKTTENSKPINDNGGNLNLAILIILILVIIVLIVIFVILAIYCPPALNMIFGVIKKCFVLFCKFIGLIFKGIGYLFKKIFKKE